MVGVGHRRPRKGGAAMLLVKGFTLAFWLAAAVWLVLVFLNR